MQLKYKIIDQSNILRHIDRMSELKHLLGKSRETRGSDELFRRFVKFAKRCFDVFSVNNARFLSEPLYICFCGETGRSFAAAVKMVHKCVSHLNGIFFQGMIELLETKKHFLLPARVRDRNKSLAISINRDSASFIIVEMIKLRAHLITVI